MTYSNTKACCEGKTAFATRADAERTLRPKAKKLGIRPYRCVACHKYHLGHYHVPHGNPTPGKSFGIDNKRNLPTFQERVAELMKCS